MTGCAQRTLPAPHCPRRMSGAGLLLVIGELDMVTASRLARRLADSPSIRVLDLSGVTFIDAAGLRAIVEATRGESEPRSPCTVDLRSSALHDRRSR